VNAEEFVDVLRKYFHRDNNPFLLATICGYLEDRPPEYLKELSKRVIYNCKWLPTVTEIRDLEAELKAESFRLSEKMFIREVVEELGIERKRLPEPDFIKTDEEEKESDQIMSNFRKDRPDVFGSPVGKIIQGVFNEYKELPRITDEKKIRQMEKKRRELEEQAKRLEA